MFAEVHIYRAFFIEKDKKSKKELLNSCLVSPLTELKVHIKINFKKGFNDYESIFLYLQNYFLNS